MTQLDLFDEMEAEQAKREAEIEARLIAEREAARAEQNKPRQCGDCGEWSPNFFGFNLNHAVEEGGSQWCTRHMLHYQHACWAGHPERHEWSVRGVEWLTEHGFALPEGDELMVNREAVA